MPLITDILNDSNINIKNFDNYQLLNYNKENININFDIYKCFRSIIIDKITKEYIVISPFKSLDLNQFIENYSNLNDNIVEEFIEGSMINLFWDKYNSNWQISTKTTIGGNVKFFSSKTFNDLFYETVTSCNLNLDELNKTICYSFVIQHPENRIVTKYHKPYLWLIEAYQIINDDIIILDTRELVKTDSFKNSYVKCPNIIKNFNNYDELIHFYKENKYNIMGVTIRNGINRTKIRNSNYEKIRLLRGNSAKLQFHYYLLLKEDKIDEYLKYFNEHKRYFKNYNEMDTKYIKKLYDYYVKCYIKKEDKLINFPTNYKTHLFNLHKIYYEQLKPKKEVINMNIVKIYVMNLDTKLHMWSVNFDNYN
jgi:hypothetical protein